MVTLQQYVDMLKLLCDKGDDAAFLSVASRANVSIAALRELVPASRSSARRKK